MLDIEVKGKEFFNDETNEFIQVKDKRLSMEHSLLSISKWEARWKKPFLSETPKTNAEKLDYIRCMTITPNVDPLIFRCLSKANLDAIDAYIEDPHTATTIRRMPGSRPKRHRTMTSELIYAIMISYRIPIQFEKWHLSRLLTLIEILEIENDPKRKKMSRQAILQQNRELNAQRRAKYNTSG
jgi:hypothetical protein